MDSHPATNPATNAATHPGDDEPPRDSEPEGPEAVEPHSPLREASTTVAGAIDSVLAASDTRHRQISETLSYLRQRQQESEDRLSQMEREQHQVAQTASTILNNQKTSARCYDEVTAALAAIRKDQQEHEQRLSDLATQLQRTERQIGQSTKRAVLIAAVAQGTAILAGVGLAVLLLG